MVGVGLVMLAAWILFFQAGMERWIPLGVAAAALVLFIGVVLMGASESLPPDNHQHTRPEHHHDEHAHH